MIWCALEKNGAICATEPWEWFSGKWSLEPGCGARAFISETVCGCGGMVGVAGFPWNESGLPDLKGMLVVFIDWIQNIWVFLLFPIKWAPSSPCLLPLDLFSPSLLYLIKANSVLKPEAKTKQSYEGLQESLFLLLSSILNPEDCWHQLKKKYLKSFTAHVLPSPQAGAGWGWGRASFYMEASPGKQLKDLTSITLLNMAVRKGLWGSEGSPRLATRPWWSSVCSTLLCTFPTPLVNTRLSAHPSNRCTCFSAHPSLCAHAPVCTPSHMCIYPSVHPSPCAPLPMCTWLHAHPSHYTPDPICNCPLCALAPTPTWPLEHTHPVHVWMQRWLYGWGAGRNWEVLLICQTPRIEQRGER